MSRRLGKNPYGEWVEELSSGTRRVCTLAGWQSEPVWDPTTVLSPLRPFRFCRCFVPELSTPDYQLCLLSLLNSDILASFGQGVAGAWQVWSASNSGSVILPQAQFLRDLQQTLIGQSVAQLRRGLAPPLPHLWSSTLFLPLEDIPLGLWYGLGQKIKIEATQVMGQYLEVGLASPGYAVTAWLPPVRTTIFASPSPRNVAACKVLPSALSASPLVSDPYLPRHVVVDGCPLPTAPAFKKTAHLPAFEWAVLWVTSANPLSPPTVQAWATWFATHQGWAIFSHTPHELELERIFGATVLASPTKVKPHRLTVTDAQAKPLYHLWHLSSSPSLLASPSAPSDVPELSSKLDLLAFAGSCPSANLPSLASPPLNKVNKLALPAPSVPPPSALTLAGSEPYLSPSPYPAEACASPSLNRAMFQALLPLWRAGSTSPGFQSLLTALGATPTSIADFLNAEQIDAILLAHHKLTSSQGFILADETGLGKGRILASLAKLGLSLGKTVVFLTENPSLFSDFYRDLLAVSAFSPVPTPTLLHAQASLYDPDGNLVLKSSPATLTKLLGKPGAESSSDRLILSTYAQLSRPSAGLDKLAWLQAKLSSRLPSPPQNQATSLNKDNAWILLDEAHNASGQSQTNLALKKLLTKHHSVVFSSATFAKTELNLDLYSSLFDFDPLTKKLFFQALADSPDLLRESLTIFMASRGSFVRRQHSPPPPPNLLWVPIDTSFQQAMSTFEQLWAHIFKLAGLLAPIANAQQLFTYLGGLLSRSTREFTLLAKLSTLLAFIQAKHHHHEKIVITMEGTFESALGAYFANLSTENPSLGSSSALPLWKSSHRLELSSLFTPEVLAHPDLSPAVSSQVNFHHQAILQCLQALPSWPLSPLDYLRDALTKLNIRSGELSGRSSQLVSTDSGFTYVPRDTRPAQRQAIVNEFNNHPLDVLFLTRAGCAGISLHAGQHFKDQRRRHLIELDIPLNPANRLQFAGRVRRKDQVIEPEFWGITIDVPLERRRFEREANKQRTLQAHIVSTNLASDASSQWLSEAGERLVVAWGKLHPGSARLLGISSFPTTALANVNRALSHCFVLSPSLQKNLVNFLDNGLVLSRSWDDLARSSLYHQPSTTLRSQWWFGDPIYTSPHSFGSLGVPRVELVERLWDPAPAIDPVQLRTLFQTALASPHHGPWLTKQFQTHASTFPQPQFGWLKQYLPLLTSGQGFSLSHPSTGQLLRSVFLGFSPPTTTSLCHTTDLSQFAGFFLAPGEHNPWLIPLDRLFADPQFQALGQASSEWFALPPAPYVELALEGNLALASALGTRLGVGQATMLADRTGGQLPAWVLPGLTWEQFSSAPRDVLGVEQVFNFWRRYPLVTLTTALPPAHSWQAVPVPGGINFVWPEKTYGALQDLYLPFQIQKKLGPPKFIDRQVVRHVSWTYARSLLFAWDKLGVSWRIPAPYLEWYRQSSANYFALPNKKTTMVRK